MKDQVVSISGGEILTPDPDMNLVAFLEARLAEAKSGEIQEVLFAAIHHDGATTMGAAGCTVNKYTLAGAASENIQLYMSGFHTCGR